MYLMLLPVDPWKSTKNSLLYFDYRWILLAKILELFYSFCLQYVLD